MERKDSSEFFGQARQFATCRRKLNHFWDTLNFKSVQSRQAPNLIENIGTVEGFNPAARQLNIHGAVVGSLEELYECAPIANVCYQEFLRNMLTSLNIKLESLRTAPLKSSQRAAEKALDDYADRIPGPSFAWLFDIVRASVECYSEEEIQSIVNFLCNSDGRMVTDGEGYSPAEIGNGVSFKMMRLKNRFRFPTAGGFRDMNMTIRLRCPLPTSAETAPSTAGSNDEPRFVEHMCELQIHHSPLKEMGKSLHSHDVYSFFRTYFRGNEEAIAKRLALFDEIFGELGEDTDNIDITNDISSNRLGAVIDRAIRERNQGLLLSLNQLCQWMNENEQWIRVQRAVVDIAESSIAARQEGQTSDLRIDQLRAIFNLGAALMSQNEFTEAGLLFTKALAGYEEILGSNSQASLECIMNLGALAGSRGENESALVLNESALRIHTQLYGAEHENTLGCLHNIGMAHSQLGHHTEGVSSLDRCLKSRDKVLGVLHPDTLSTVKSLGLAYMRAGNLEAARVYLVRSAEGFERVYGPNHDHSLGALCNLGIVHERCGQFEEARDCYIRALEGQKLVMGAAHPSALMTMVNLASVQSELGDDEAALELYKTAVVGLDQALGPTHRTTLIALNNQARLLLQLGRMEEAENGLKMVYDRRCQIRGPASTEAVYSLLALCDCREKRNRHKEAVEGLTDLITTAQARVVELAGMHMEGETWTFEESAQHQRAIFDALKLRMQANFALCELQQAADDCQRALEQYIAIFDDPEHPHKQYLERMSAAYAGAAALFHTHCNAPRDWPANITHPVHEVHPLLPSNWNAGGFNCDSCGEFGLGFRYCCKMANDGTAEGGCDVDVCIACCESLIAPKSDVN